VNCFLYDIREDVELRRADWNVQCHANVAARRKPPVRFDVTYQVTVWARAPEDEHGLLWRLLATLARFPILPHDLLLGDLVDQPFPIPVRLAQPDGTRTSATDLWQALDNRVRPSLAYVVTLALDPSLTYTSPIVLSRVARVGSTIGGLGQTEEIPPFPRAASPPAIAEAKPKRSAKRS
jgi:hypothetical protein